MRTVFKADFKDEGALASWSSEQHAPEGYPDFRITEGSLEFLDAGNRLLPHAPTVSDFMVEGQIHTQRIFGKNTFSLTVHFDYDPDRRCGRRLEIASDGENVRLYSDGREVKVHNKKDIVPSVIRGKVIRFRIERRKTRLILVLNQTECWQGRISAGSGRIALERGHFAGSLYLSDFTVAAAVPDPVLIKQVRIPFPHFNGMPNDIFWQADFWKNGDVVQVNAELSGGVVDREPVPWFPYHGAYAEMLTAPYFKIRFPSGREIQLTMTVKLLNLRNGSDPYYYMKGIGYEKPEWPLKRTFHLPFFDPGKILLACGYEHYICPVDVKFFAGGPSEIIYDPASDKIVYAGTALADDRVNVELFSAPNRRLLNGIRKDHPLKSAAERYILMNHYFFEGEKCDFHFRVSLKDDFPLDEFEMEYVFANAFLEPAGPWKKLPGMKQEKPVPGLMQLSSGKISGGKLKAGVYHLLFRCRQGRKLLAEDSRAFEVMSDRQSGPEASRLPLLYSTPCEVSGVSGNEFDPFLPYASDVCHYISVAAGVMPHIVEKQQVAELYKLYHRKWFPWFTPRTTENQKYENYPSIGSCDYIALMSEWQKLCLVRICCRAFYTGPQIQVLADFGKLKKFHAGELARCAEKDQYPSLEIFQELIDRHFCEWMDYFNEQFRRNLEKMKRELEKVNPHAGLANYGPLAIYPAAYKTAHSCQYIFSYLTRPGGRKSVYQDGKSYFNFADLPYCCRHNNIKGPFMTADILLEYPNVRICPEIYTPNKGGPCPDAAVARAWPSLGMHWASKPFPVNATLKRVLEYVYGSIRHDGKSFRYWEERGFHARTWDRSRYLGFLRLWGFIEKHTPARPAGRVCAFLCSEECIRAHKYYYDEYGEKDLYTPYGDLFNTAEDTPAYAYEMSRTAGLNAGVVINEKSLQGLTGQDIDVLILPPLTGASKRSIAEIRRLHEKEGVALFGFEDVSGLEDLFGVKAAKDRQVHRIRPCAGLPDELQRLSEYTEHRAVRGKYKAAGASVLLDGEIPVLFSHKTRFGKTSLYNIPPTAVRREDQYNRVGMGRDSISPLINSATQFVLRGLSRKDVETSCCKIIAFRDIAGHHYLVVEEDEHPLPEKVQSPLVTVRGKDLVPGKFDCPENCSVVKHTPELLTLRLHLKENDIAIIPLSSGRVK